MNNVLSTTYCQIQNFPNYLIDDSGNVWSKKSNKMLAPIISKGYVKANLYTNRKCKIMAVHRLVALTFIPNPNNLPEINHKDGDKSNNHVSNLEWCDSKHNKKHAALMGLNVPKKGENHHSSKLTDNQIEEIRNLYVPRVMTTRMLAKKYGISQQQVSGIVLGKRR